MKTKKTTKKVAKAPAPANERPTINAEAVDELFTDIQAKIMALQIVWEKISLKEELES